MTTFKIILIVAVFKAIAYAPLPCQAPATLEHISTDTLLVYEDTCRPCALQVYNQALQQKGILQIGTNWANMITTVTMDSIPQP